MSAVKKTSEDANFLNPIPATKSVNLDLNSSSLSKINLGSIAFLIGIELELLEKFMRNVALYNQISSQMSLMGLKFGQVSAKAAFDSIQADAANLRLQALSSFATGAIMIGGGIGGMYASYKMKKETNQALTEKSKEFHNAIEKLKEPAGAGVSATDRPEAATAGEAIDATRAKYRTILDHNGNVDIPTEEEIDQIQGDPALKREVLGNLKKQQQHIESEITHNNDSIENLVQRFTKILDGVGKIAESGFRGGEAINTSGKATQEMLRQLYQALQEFSNRSTGEVSEKAREAAQQIETVLRLLADLDRLNASR